MKYKINFIGYICLVGIVVFNIWVFFHISPLHLFPLS